jgi:hypothetical protein
MMVGVNNQKANETIRKSPENCASDAINNGRTTTTLPSLTNAVSTSLNGLDIMNEIRGKYSSDTLFRNVILSLKEFKNFEFKNDVLYLRNSTTPVLCMPKVLINGRNIREIIIGEAHSMLAHLGPRKTLLYLRDHVWWKEMVQDVSNYCDSCITCKRSKPSNHKPYGLLNPLQVPNTPWESIGMDFVGPLPESKDRNSCYDSITVIIDRLTGMVHLVPSKQTYNARQVAELVFSEVYRLHRLPKTIISDRDTLFTSTFWKRLNELIGTKLNMSSAYHPETDGSTERANRTITQMLRQCVSPTQKDWVSKLPAIELAINSARSEVTGYAPFFLNYGRIPRSFIWNDPKSNEYPGVRIFATKLKNAIIAAHDSILAHRIKEIRAANRKRLPSPFKKGKYISPQKIFRFPAIWRENSYLNTLVHIPSLKNSTTTRFKLVCLIIYDAVEFTMFFMLLY